MKKIFLCFISILLTFQFAKADDFYFCGVDYPADEYFYNLFSQEIIDDPQYYPFLRSNELFYGDYPNFIQNENIESWQNYFDIDYTQAEYLVYSASREEIRHIIQNKSSSVQELDFIDADFVNAHKQALLYLAYAKYLEPYMKMKQYTWGDDKSIEDLDYDRVIEVLEKNWNAETQADLKIRYGYQMVRFAHYYKKFDQAVYFFDKYVACLDYKPVMYYYALDQKAGAEYGLGNYQQANLDFLKVFIHTKNRKKSAFLSMKFTRQDELDQLLESLESEKEKNELFLLMGYNQFYNPNSFIRKITENSPNAIQAKVLMARAVNQLEREFFPVNYYCFYTFSDCPEDLGDRYLPLLPNQDAQDFLAETLKTVKGQLEKESLEDLDFWNITAAYLYFIQKEFDKSLDYLGRVKSEESKYTEQKARMEVLIEITREKGISPEYEKQTLKYYMQPSGFITDILANRYFMQGDYAKSFLLQNSLYELASNPDLRLINAVIDFYAKTDTNAFEEFIMQNAIKNIKDVNEEKINSILANIQGSVYLSMGESEKALEDFNKIKDNFSFLRYSYSGKRNYNGYGHIPNTVFGYNRIECFTCENTMVTDYLEDFPFIQNEMNKREMTESILKLEKIAQSNASKAAKAGFLLANFYYNTSSLGYHREILSFQLTNGNSAKFRKYQSEWDFMKNPNEYSERFYFKNYGDNPYFEDYFEIPLKYLDRALNQTDDDELKAKIVFAAAKIEQAYFYKDGEKEFQEEIKDFSYSPYSEIYQTLRREFKRDHYRKYFEELRGNYAHTDYYQEVKTYCKYFDYYQSHY